MICLSRWCFMINNYDKTRMRLNFEIGLNPNLKKLRSLWLPAKSLFRNMEFKRPGYKNRFLNTSPSLKTRYVSFKKRSRNWNR